MAMNTNQFYLFQTKGGALFIALLLVASVGCRKTLDLEGGTCFPIKVFLQSKNANQPCGKQSVTEQKLLCLRGMATYAVDDAGKLHAVSLVDSEDHTKQIEIIFPPSLGDALITVLHLNRWTEVKVNAHLQGFDMPGNTKCKRGFELVVTDINQIQAL
jgi:hypothetical protein